jgi:hypothetical protein
METHEEKPIAREPWQRLLQEDGDGPPDTTDARIRAAARRALRPRVSRWLLPVSLAASVVLAVVIVERQYGDRGVGELVTEKDVAAPAATAPPPREAFAPDGETPSSSPSPRAVVADLPAPPPTDSPRRQAERPADEALKDATVAGSGLPATERARQASSEARDGEARAESPPAAFSSEVKERMRSPEDWYATIEKLRAAGRTEEADRELERLEAAYPGWLERHLEETTGR